MSAVIPRPTDALHPMHRPSPPRLSDDQKEAQRAWLAAHAARLRDAMRMAGRAA